jgi:hypothetical protein
MGARQHAFSHARRQHVAWALPPHAAGFHSLQQQQINGQLFQFCPALAYVYVCLPRRQVPEHWQQHLQTLQEAPFRGGMGSSAAPPQASFRAGRASSAGIDALAEAAAAALAAHPELMQERGATATSARQAEGAEAPQGAAGSDAGRPAPCRKRVREQQAAKAEMGPPGSSYKRPCAGAGAV